MFISAILEGTSACRRGVDEQYRSLSTDLSAETPASRTPETTSTRWPRINGSRIASKPTLFNFYLPIHSYRRTRRGLRGAAASPAESFEIINILATFFYHIWTARSLVYLCWRNLMVNMILCSKFHLPRLPLWVNVIIGMFILDKKISAPRWNHAYLHNAHLMIK